MSATVDQKSLESRFNTAIDSRSDDLIDQVIQDVLSDNELIAPVLLGPLVHTVVQRSTFGSWEQRALEKLQSAGASLDFVWESDGQTPLLHALSSTPPKTAVALWLIKHGADVLAQHPITGQTALMYAVVQDNWLLLTRSFSQLDVEKYVRLTTTRDAEGHNVFQYAYLTGPYGDIVRGYLREFLINNLERVSPTLYLSKPTIRSQEAIIRDLVQQLSSISLTGGRLSVEPPPITVKHGLVRDLTAQFHAICDNLEARQTLTAPKPN